MDRKKHWSELGRVKSSAWFKNLPALEKEAVLAALENDTHESALKLRATLAFVYLTIVYAAAFIVWGLVFRAQFYWLCVSGPVVGAAGGLYAGMAIAKQKTPRAASAMQTAMAMRLGSPGIILAAVGIVVWLVR